MVWFLIPVLCVCVVESAFGTSPLCSMADRNYSPIPWPLQAEVTSSVKAGYLLYLPLGLSIQRSNILFTECKLDTLKILLLQGQNVFRDLRLREYFYNEKVLNTLKFPPTLTLILLTWST